MLGMVESLGRKQNGHIRRTSTVLATVGVMAALISALNWRGGGEGLPKLDVADRER